VAFAEGFVSVFTDEEAAIKETTRSFGEL